MGEYGSAKVASGYWGVQVLSDFIVVNRGIVPKTIKSGMDNIQQVSLIVHSTYQAATEPDPDGGLPDPPGLPPPSPPFRPALRHALLLSGC